ncbi:MAG: molybdopterin-synthase adenylyltransferase MoeB [Anaerolineales bacterium]
MTLPPLTHQEILRYSRHLLLPQIGLQGQQKLKQASVLIIGGGGLGSPAALYLAAAGVGTIGIVDFDTVSESNLQRQILYGQTAIGQPKAHAAHARLHDLNPHIQIHTYNQPFTSHNARRIAAPYPILLDATDNFPTRYLINDLAVLEGKIAIYGAIYRFDGQISVFNPRTGPCYRCIYPAPPPPELTPTCAEGGVLGVLPGIIGALQATEALKHLLGIGSPLTGKLLLYDALETTFQTIRLHKNPRCRICGEHADLHDLTDYPEFCGLPQNHLHPQENHAGAEWNLTPQQFRDRLQTFPPPLLLDVREPHEQHIATLAGAQNLPLGTLPQHLHTLPQDRDLLIYCKSGVRSSHALQILHSAGFRRAYHLTGGINAWAQQIDPSLPIY